MAMTYEKSSDDIRFLLEFILNQSGDRGFVEALRENSKDKAARNAYADWLEEHLRPEAADMIRRGFVPGVGWTEMRQAKPTRFFSGTLE